MSLEQKKKIERIQYMESIFDQIQTMLASGISKNDASLKEKVQILLDYYESEQWKKDYESDERGEFPADLKRGVLSEDGVYNLLTEIQE